jgi:LAO/AO transport system kinase
MSVDELASAIRAGSVRSLARGLTWVEAGGARAEALVEALHPHTRGRHVIGITGAPGAGKSTLVQALVAEARARALTVGVLAIDPSSPYTGGAILGDRIRMSNVAGDAGVFIRSVATRGALGGLSRQAGDAIDLMCAAGRQVVFVETVGVGQDEVDVMRVAHTIVVVSVPGLGDEIQALKAGIIEIADIHAVNKADREGADRTVAELKTMLALGRRAGADWSPPVVACVAATGTGVPQLFDHILNHYAGLITTGDLLRREHRMAEARVLKLAQSLVADTFHLPAADDAARLGADIDRVARRELSPFACARALLTRASDSTKVSSHV